MSEEFEIIDQDIKVVGAFNNEYTKVTIVSPNQLERTPSDICAVVDVSGSMGTEAQIKTNTGSESHGLSILDIVKHALKTIAKSLSDKDQFSIVIFDDTATIVLDHANDIPSILEKIEGIRLGGSTNLWDGLLLGLKVLEKGNLNNKSLLILTDGLPNVSPPRGELAAFQQHIDTNKLNCTVNTFGFGYNLDSKLLKELAVAGNGTFAFIADASMVGTVFINAIANTYTTIAQQLVLSITTQGATVGEQISKASWGYQIKLGNLLAGQNRDVVVKGKVDKIDLAFLNKSGKSAMIFGTITNTHDEFDASCRLLAIQAINSAYALSNKSEFTEAKEVVKSTIAAISGYKSTPLIVGILKDLDGQVSEACSRQEWFTRWGRHYMLNLSLAHHYQICNNFKDPGVQNYGNTLFKQLQTEIEDIFMKLPPPTPSIQHYDNSGASYNGTVSMSSYQNSGNPCVDGNGVVMLVNGGSKLVCELQKGDILGNGATVQCVIKTEVNDTIPMVSINKLHITPWHPVLVDDKWDFPLNLQSPQMIFCSAIYSFILDSKHVLMVNNVKMVTLGHGFDDKVVFHPYFGNGILADLKKCKGFESGLITMTKNWLKRGENGDIVGIQRGI